jgi:hypothetical protein
VSDHRWVSSASNEWTLIIDGKAVGGVFKPVGCVGCIAWTHRAIVRFYATTEEAKNEIEHMECP